MEAAIFEAPLALKLHEEDRPQRSRLAENHAALHKAVFLTEAA